MIADDIDHVQTPAFLWCMVELGALHDQVAPLASLPFFAAASGLVAAWGAGGAGAVPLSPLLLLLLQVTGPLRVAVRAAGRRQNPHCDDSSCPL